MGIALIISITLFVLSLGMNIRQFDLYKSATVEIEEKNEKNEHLNVQVKILSNSLTGQAKHLKELEEVKQKLRVFEAQKTAVDGLIKKYEEEKEKTNA